MDDLNSDARGHEDVRRADPTEDLIDLIAQACATRDRTAVEIDFDEIVLEIERDHPQTMVRLGLHPARKLVRKMVKSHCQRMAAMNPDEEDGPQIAIPGLERLPTHVMYTVTN